MCIFIYFLYMHICIYSDNLSCILPDILSGIVVAYVCAQTDLELPYRLSVRACPDRCGAWRRSRVRVCPDWRELAMSFWSEMTPLELVLSFGAHNDHERAQGGGQWRKKGRGRSMGENFSFIWQKGKTPTKNAEPDARCWIGANSRRWWYFLEAFLASQNKWKL